MSDITTLVESQREQFAKVVSIKSIQFDREREFAMQIYERKDNDYFRKVANANPQSFANSLVNVAAIGISLNPASKLAYLVPRKSEICLDISYMGLMHIAQECGAIQWGQAVIVHEKDTRDGNFKLRDIGQQPHHIYNPFDTERGPIVGVYVVVKTDGGDFLTHSMPIAKVYDIRDRSDAYKSKKGPWITDEAEMIKKTCVKQASKYWPRRERLDNAVHYLNTEGGEGITLKANTMPEAERDEWAKKINAAPTKEKAKDVWREAFAICEELGDRESAEILKDVLIARGEAIDKAVPVQAKAA